MDRIINVGLVGFGVTAQVMHAPFLLTQPQYAVKAVVERHKTESRKLFPGATIVPSFEALLELANIDLVVITTPNESHFPYAKAALEAGRHVVVEKPFTISSAEASALVALAAQGDRVLSVFQNRRYVADFITMQSILAQGLLGDIHTFEGHFDRYRPDPKPNAWREEPRPGSGILYDLGPHLIDQALCLFGLPHSITADIRLQRPHARVDDFFDLRLDYGFTRVTLQGGMLVRAPGPRYQLHGTRGSFLKWGEDPQEALLKEGRLPNTADWGREPEEQYGLLHTVANGKTIREKYPSLQGHFGLYYHHLYQSLAHGAPVREKPEHGFNTIRLVELAFESSKARKTIACEGLLHAPYPAAGPEDLAASLKSL